ncbi:MAG: glutathione S-transferase N-terminal domain-containing protein [Hyphomicrobiales bacterium]|nr:glutathione S-transferase N-terminal domain-containing protein [Hyphomicrobiales bacterium]
MIDFYYAPTPNGWKVAIMLEECGLDHELHLLRLGEGDQFKPAFLAISPNAKMPAILDHDPPTAYGSEPVPVFESGAILFYLAEKTGRFMPADARGRKEALEWLFWQSANQGPLAGQLSHFVNYAPEGQDYARARYAGEYERNLAVLERRLADRDFILGDYSIADMIAFPWVFIAKPLGVSLDAFPRVADWRGRLKDRPAIQRVIEQHKAFQADMRNQNSGTNKVLFNQTAAHLLGIGKGDDR